MKSNHSFDIYHLLRNKKSESILTEIKLFINKHFDDICINNNNNIIKIANEFQEFLFKITLSFSKEWSIDFECHENTFSIISDSFESLLTKALNRKIFQVISTDYNIDAIIRKYSFLTLTHLGITIQIDHFALSNQIKNFVPICQFKSTIEKSNCVVNLCNYLIVSYPEISLVLLLTYTLISSEIPLLCENILFATLFRSKASINGTEDYYLNQLSSAIELIRNLETNNSFLSICHFQFQNYCLEYEKKQLTHLLLDNSINEVENKEKEKKNHSPKVDNAIITLINKIVFISTNHCKEHDDDDNNNNEGKSNNYSRLNKGHGKENESLLSIPIAHLKNDYCLMEFKEMSYKKIEQLYIDFKILLKIIQSS